MCGEPRSSRWEHSPQSAVYRTCYAPKVGVMMRNPAATAVHLTCRLGSRVAQITNHVEERHLRLGDISHESRPVVHLGVNVDGVF